MAGRSSEKKKLQETPASNEPKNTDFPEAIFARKFTESGGKFVFCENKEEILDTLKNIAEEENAEVISCNDPKLKNLLLESGIQCFTELSKPADAAFITCELLIVKTGAILVTANQTFHNKINSLPNTIIVFARTNQILDKLNNALTAIKMKYPPKEIPSMITTLKGPKSDGFEDPNSVSATKNIYLILTY
ncbi:hypothetical protein AT05_06240 [Schleiferia thermophila str. Yellowstone]|nr:hypothetical protein AT05_06240 [Schleiferia thermophila str. Yellowstone]